MTETRKINRRRKQLRKDQTIIRLGAFVICTKVPAWLLETFEASHVAPLPPMIKQSVIGGGEDEVENWDDPTYVAALEEYTNKQGRDLANLCFDFCEALPESTAQEQEWMAKLERWGIPDTSENRLKAFCLPEAAEHTTIMVKEVMRLSAVTQEETALAEASFQPEVDGLAGGPAGPPEEQSDV